MQRAIRLIEFNWSRDEWGWEGWLNPFKVVESSRRRNAEIDTKWTQFDLRQFESIWWIIIHIKTPVRVSANNAYSCTVNDHGYDSYPLSTEGTSSRTKKAEVILLQFHCSIISRSVCVYNDSNLNALFVEFLFDFDVCTLDEGILFCSVSNWKQREKRKCDCKRRSRTATHI